MDKLKKIIDEKRSIKDSTWVSYSRTINELSKAINGGEYTNISFLKKKDKIKKYIDSKGNAKQRMLLSVILLLLSPGERNKPDKKNEKLYDHYKSMLIIKQADYMNGQREQKKNIKQSENWVEMKDLLKVQRKYGNDLRKRGYKQSTKKLHSKSDLMLIQKYLISSLYLLHPPRRLEYADMKIIKSPEYNKLSDDDKKDNNYLVIVSRNKKFFSFGTNAVKSSTVEDVYKIPLDRGLNSVINLWLNFNDTEYLLQNSNGGKMTQNTLGKFLVKTFSSTGKKISANMLRHIFLSDKYKDEASIKEKEDTAKKMNHSTGIAESIYIKKD